MEEQRMANQTDYWLVQYQRLLDSKPQSFVDQVFSIMVNSIAVFFKLSCAFCFFSISITKAL